MFRYGTEQWWAAIQVATRGGGVVGVRHNLDMENSGVWPDAWCGRAVAQLPNRGLFVAPSVSK